MVLPFFFVFLLLLVFSLSLLGLTAPCYYFHHQPTNQPTRTTTTTTTIITLYLVCICLCWLCVGTVTQFQDSSSPTVSFCFFPFLRLCWGRSFLSFQNILLPNFSPFFYEALYFVNEWWGDEGIDDLLLFGIPSFSLFVVYVALCFEKKYFLGRCYLFCANAYFFLSFFCSFFLIQIVHNHLDSPPIIPTHTNGSK